MLSQISRCQFRKQVSCEALPACFCQRVLFHKMMCVLVVRPNMFHKHTVCTNNSTPTCNLRWEFKRNMSKQMSCTNARNAMRNAMTSIK